MTPREPGLFPHPRGEQQELGAGPNPLDEPQSFDEASSYEIRDELQGIVERDLLGPWDGEHERFTPKMAGPRERYLVGMLGPKRGVVSTVEDAGELPDTEAGARGDGESELPDVTTPQSLGRIWASSMGLSFAVSADTDILAVTASWGHYRKQEVPDPDDPENTSRRAWCREPIAHQRDIRLDGPESDTLALTDTGVALSVHIRHRGDRRVVELALINAQAEPQQTKDTAWLFQTAITVTALDGASAIFPPIADITGDTGIQDQEESHLRLLYRGAHRYANGRNVAVHADVRDGETDAHRLATTWLPHYEVPATGAPVDEGTPLATTELSMDELAAATPAELHAGLAPLADGYTAWLDEQEAALGTIPEPQRDTARHALSTARKAAARIRAGIDLLGDPSTRGHGDAYEAFRFANTVMAAQRRRTSIGALRETGLSFADAQSRVDARGAAAASWRPFQLAFVLLNLPSLTDPEHPERAADATGTVDLLFFPTGGGKTEAYLGLTAFTFAIRRLQGVLGTGTEARSGEAGTAVLMRYTLRLLTAQQFQRAAALVCAAEVERRADQERWGTEPFRIGLWVGGAVSPNWFTEAANQVAEARESGKGNHVNALQTLACPWCGEPLRAQHDLRVTEDVRRILLFCPNAEGPEACPFSATRCEEGLPILTVDEEIYRYAPSLVIATVDKLAQLPWRGYAGILFGRTREYCSRHGYRHADLDAKTGCRSKHNAKGDLPAVTSRPVARLRPPDLIIQDELHLISGALGTTVGLFESAVDELCTWRAGGTQTGPKIVASTATTKRAAEQVLGVFGRGLAIFPPQVSDVTDTFFSRQVPITPGTPGRRYLGVCAHGTRMKSAEIRLAEILLIAGQTLLDRYGEAADPYLTVVGYFNAVRELAGMRRYLDDDVTTRIRTHGHRKGLSDRLTRRNEMLTIQELTSRISSGDISEVLKKLEIGFDAELDTSERRRRIAEDVRAVARANKGKSLRSKDRLDYHPLADARRARDEAGRVPADVVLATSMLQVGVDIARFGLMVVTGQPKNTAEYIQATSRIGRDPARPGLVVTLYNWARPRDLAHFEDFEHYHATFYRQVEALSVTPYTRRSLDRTTAGMFVAAVRNAAESHSHNADAHDVPLDGEVVTGITARMLDRAAAVGGDRAREYLAERITAFTGLWRRATTGQTRLGYSTGSAGKEQLVGLLEAAGQRSWGDRTVAHSMRETENEINLLFPGGGEIYTPLYDAPEWTFTGTDDSEDEDAPEGDEMGESTLETGGKA